MVAAHNFWYQIRIFAAPSPQGGGFDLVWYNEIMLNIFVFLLGLAVGSFLNCVIYRLETGQSFLKGRSFCPHCHHQLGFRDLIPVLSFLLLRGCCRYCHQKISFQYPLVELATGILFVAALNFTGTSPLYFIIACFLVVIFVYDLKHFIIPDKVIYLAIAIAGVFNFFAWPAALGAAAFFGTIVLASRGRWMGVGDIKLAFLMGLILGFPNILAALFLAFLIGAIIGIGLMISGKKTLKSEVPFGPFLVTGTMISLFWGQQITEWYLSII